MATENKDLDLEEQLAILGVDLGVGATAQVPPVQPTVTKAVPQPQPAQPVQQVVKSTTPPAQPVPSTASDEVVFIDLAKAVNSQKTPWLRLKDNERSRVLILDLTKVIPIKVHYMKGLGFFKCLSSYTPEGWLDQPAECCCKKNELGQMVPRLDEEGHEIKSKRRYLVPVVEYPVSRDNHNQVIPGQQPQLKMWNANAVEWGDLLSAVQGCADNPDDLSTADLSNIDFALYKDASSQFKTIKVSVTPKTFRTQYEAQINAEAAKVNSDFYKDALKEARKVLPIETIVNSYNAQEAVNNAVNNMIENSTMGSQDLDI